MWKLQNFETWNQHTCRIVDNRLVRITRESTLVVDEEEVDHGKDGMTIYFQDEHKVEKEHVVSGSISPLLTNRFSVHVGIGCRQYNSKNNRKYAQGQITESSRNMKKKIVIVKHLSYEGALVTIRTFYN